MCSHLRTEISTPNENGKSILKCKDCNYTKEIISGYFAIDDALRSGVLKSRQRTSNDKATSERLYDFDMKTVSLRN